LSECIAAYITPNEIFNYILPTFIKYAHVTGKDEFTIWAGSIGRWSLQLQEENGSFAGLFGTVRADRWMFNTGEILLGLVSWFREFGEGAFLDSDWETS